MSDTWCALPWVHVCVRPNEKVKPCCRFLHAEGEAEVAPLLQDYDPNDEFMRQLRADMLAGVRRPECRKCYDQEAALRGHKRNQSLRHWMNSIFDDLSPNDCTEDFQAVKYIEMSLDNLCNFECRMCDSKFSSKLQLRDRAMGWRVHKKLEPAFHKFDRFDLSQLRYIKLLGGEPLMSPNLNSFIDYLENRGAQPERIRLQISTNGSRRLDDAMLDRLRQFQYLEINVSLDSYTDANDYQRHGGYYKDTYANARWYQEQLENSHVNFHSVISVYTANHLATTLRFLMDENNHDVSVDWVRDPEWQSLLVAPPEFINWVLEKNSHHEFAHKLVANFVKNAEYNPEAWQQLLNTTVDMDRYYKRYLQVYNPEVCEKLYETYSI